MLLILTRPVRLIMQWKYFSSVSHVWNSCGKILNKIKFDDPRDLQINFLSSLLEGER